MRREMKSKTSEMGNSLADWQGRHGEGKGQRPGTTGSRRHVLTHMQQKGPEGGGVREGSRTHGLSKTRQDQTVGSQRQSNVKLEGEALSCRERSERTAPTRNSGRCETRKQPRHAEEKSCHPGAFHGVKKASGRSRPGVSHKQRLGK